MKLLLAALVSVSACAGPVDPGLRPDFPGKVVVSDDVDWADTHFTGAGGVQLYAQRWRPRSGEPKAVVVIHHGLDDHSSRYAELATQLVHAGYAVWAFDIRGHARSAGSRASFDNVDDLLADLDAFMKLVRANEPHRKLFLYGHSLGGAVTSLYVIERQPEVGGLVIASSAITVDAPPILAAATPILAALAPTAPALALDHTDFSQRADVVSEMDKDPLIYQPPMPARTARTALQAASRVWRSPERLTVPLLAIHGTQDRAAAPAGTRDLFARAGSRDKTLRMYDGLRHDTLREPNGQGERVRAEIVEWLDAHTGGPAITYTSSPATSPLLGDRRGNAISIEIDARDEQPRADMSGDPAITAGTRVRFGAGRATALGLGYYGGLDARAGYVDGGYYEVDLHALGFALRGARGALLSLTGAFGLGGVRGNDATHMTTELGVEIPAGPVRLLGRASLGWRVSGDHYMDDANGIADELSALVGVRLGRDHRYWADLAGGGGPYVGVTYRDLGGSELLGVSLGVDLWGGN